jgi:hypothetical protein
MDCEVLLPKIARRGEAMLRAMVAAAPEYGVRCKVTERYRGDAPWLMSYGLGHPERMRWTDAHVAGGGRLIGWDMGYWDRGESMRLSLDAQHPKRLPDMPADRWDRAGIKLREDADQDGPVVLVGMGRKSRAQFGFGGQEWELRALAEIRAALPRRDVLYRPKKPETLADCRSLYGPVEAALQGASLVVCRHSNVAVDACIAGVPVVCTDGAASTLYTGRLDRPTTPTVADRLRFLRNLAWWQWKPSEAVQAWRFLLQA